jgi:hypothetical protein
MIDKGFQNRVMDFSNKLYEEMLIHVFYVLSIGWARPLAVLRYLTEYGAPSTHCAPGL